MVLLLGTMSLGILFPQMRVTLPWFLVLFVKR